MVIIPTSPVPPDQEHNWKIQEKKIQMGYQLHKACSAKAAKYKIIKKKSPIWLQPQFTLFMTKETLKAIKASKSSVNW